MSRKRFIEEQGAICKNWNWSWSFVNNEEQIVIFGASDVHETGERQLILSKGWQTNLKGKKLNGYGQAVEHIDLILEQGFKLKTFRQVEELKDPSTGAVQIVAFDRILEDRLLKEESDGWYALPLASLEDTSSAMAPGKIFYIEGTRALVTSVAVERNPKARAICLEHYGPICQVCAFDFGKVYGLAGEGFIHVHHLHPLAESSGRRAVSPIDDLCPVCPNCHAIIHRGSKMRTIEEMRTLLTKPPGIAQ